MHDARNDTEARADDVLGALADIALRGVVIDAVAEPGVAGEVEADPSAASGYRYRLSVSTVPSQAVLATRRRGSHLPRRRSR